LRFRFDYWKILTISVLFELPVARRPLLFSNTIVWKKNVVETEEEELRDKTAQGRQMNEKGTMFNVQRSTFH
jgi:hypothetical protein